MKKPVIFPPLYGIRETLQGNTVRHLVASARTVDAEVTVHKSDRLRGRLITPADRSAPTLVVPGPKAPLGTKYNIVSAPLKLLDEGSATDLRNQRWLKHADLAAFSDSAERRHEYLARVIRSWDGVFSFVQEDPDHNIVGLRTPQLGALHAVHAHWTVSNDLATVVMPTGTGKTETMLSILVSRACEKVLVVVPTDALRSQLAEKFMTLGILKHEGSRILRETALRPVVGVLAHKPKSAEDVDAFFGACHVIVTTSHIAGTCKPAVQTRMAELCPYLFIDEAHHAEAPTWLSFRSVFSERRIVQFTATPFREDGKALDGKIIYKYPLRRAQEEGYFRPIKFDGVDEYHLALADRAIAKRAIKHLKADRTGKHIVMARVANTKRADEVFALYKPHTTFNPVQLHTGIHSKQEREEVREAIISGRSRIVVCVDMLGEGFDLPELKIAAFHDIRKSLAVTLQLAGRFTRARTDLGDPVFIANTGDVDVRDELRKLYARDPDWNQLLPEFSDQAIAEQVNLSEFVQGFAHFTSEIPILRIRPATSTVVYRTRCSEWTPEKFREGIPGIDSLEQVHSDVNHAEHTLVIVTGQKVPVVWAQNEQVYDWLWELLIVVWDPEQNLLFINSSSNQGLFKSLARKVAGDDADLIDGNVVFRIFSGVNRLTLQNVGLTEQLGRLIRYTGRMGSDVEPGMSEAQKRNARRTVISGKGFEDGKRVTVGASRRGRIWSMRRVHVEALVAWCKRIGAKVIDPTIDPTEILRGTVESTTVSQLPDSPPVAVDWPEVVYTEPETAYEFLVDETQVWPLAEAELRLLEQEDPEELQFALTSEEGSVRVSLRVFAAGDDRDYRYSIEEGRTVSVRVGASKATLAEFFYEEPPMVWFADGASLEGNTYTPLKSSYPPYPRERIVGWDWSGVDLRKESQGLGKARDSIQYRVIEVLRSRNYDLIVDDDGAGEAADLVTARVVTAPGGQQHIAVELYHCKYSKREPGRRIKDLYEVCGQAQKCVRWMRNDDKQTELFTHLLRRDAKRRGRNEPTRIEVGDRETLKGFQERSRALPIRMSVFIVQPGLLSATATTEQLDLLSVTENYLLETYQLAFGVIASP